MQKQRRRVVLWPKWVNEELEDVPTLTLVDVVDSATDVQPNSYARCYDAKAG